MRGIFGGDFAGRFCEMLEILRFLHDSQNLGLLRCTRFASCASQ
ncbi:hypothetical protein [Helicobacter sp. 23-1045]